MYRKDGRVVNVPYALAASDLHGSVEMNGPPPSSMSSLAVYASLSAANKYRSGRCRVYDRGLSAAPYPTRQNSAVSR